MFGIGAFFCPFIAEPFLKEISDSDFELPSSTAKLPLTTELSTELTTELSSNSSDVSITPLTVDPSTLTLKYAFYIIGILSFVTWTIFLITYLKKRSNKPHPTREVKVKNANKNESVVKIEVVKIEPELDSNQRTITSTNGDMKLKGSLNLEKEIRPYHKAIMVLLAGKIYDYYFFGKAKY